MINTHVESQFDKYMLEREIYVIKYIDEKMACRIMGITLDELNEYLAQEYQGSFSEVVNKYRIAAAQDIWSQAGKMSIRCMAQEVGFSNALVLLWHFWKCERCLPSVWKKRMLIQL